MPIFSMTSAFVIETIDKVARTDEQIKLASQKPVIEILFICKGWRGTGGREPGRIRAGGGREAGADGAGCGSHVRAGGGRRMRDIKFLNDFLVPF